MQNDNFLDLNSCGDYCLNNRFNNHASITNKKKAEKIAANLMVYERASVFLDEKSEKDGWKIKTPCRHCDDTTLIERKHWLQSNPYPLNSSYSNAQNSNSHFNSSCNETLDLIPYSRKLYTRNYYPSTYKRLLDVRASEQKIEKMLNYIGSNENEDNGIFFIVYFALLLITVANWFLKTSETFLKCVKNKLGNFVILNFKNMDHYALIKKERSIKIGMILMSPILMIAGIIYSLTCIGVTIIGFVKQPVPENLKLFNVKNFLKAEISNVTNVQN